MSSAAVVHSIAKACVSGALSYCPCGKLPNELSSGFKVCMLVEWLRRKTVQSTAYIGFESWARAIFLFFLKFFLYLVERMQ